MNFKDHFSGHADDYGRYRPTYPDALFVWLAGKAPARDTAWDCGTGNGQAARGMCGMFDRVVATDASSRQIAVAYGPDNIDFRVARAEDSGLASGSVDLVTVAQAVHWFDLDRFYAEVRRVLRPGGLLAVWTYTLLTEPQSLATPVRYFARHTVGQYWPEERKWVDDAYRTLSFPFLEIDPPSMEMHAQWTLPEFLGYIGTWSSVRRCRDATGNDPVPGLGDRITPLWGPARRRLNLRWPLAMRAGYPQN